MFSVIVFPIIRVENGYYSSDCPSANEPTRPQVRPIRDCIADLLTIQKNLTETFCPVKYFNDLQQNLGLCVFTTASETLP